MSKNTGFFKIALLGTLSMLALQANASPQDGKAIFNGKGGCVACHGFGTGDKPTGPDLKDVTKRRTSEWLTKWIADPVAMSASDPVGKELLAKFNGVQMPKLPLSEAEIASLIDYLKEQDTSGAKTEGFTPLSKSEFSKAKDIFFDLCSGCHGAKRWGATGPSLLPTSHIENSKEIQGGGTLSRGTEALKAIVQNGTAKGMPSWGRDGVLSPEQVDLMVRYVQMDPPPVPKLTLGDAMNSWNLVVPVNKRPKKDESEGRFKNYMGVILRDAGQVAIIDGDTKEKVAVVDTGKAVHILRSSKSGRYFYTIGRDGRLALIDLWYKIPQVVARVRTCWDARSVDSSKAPGFEDKYAIVGCYSPNQYSVMDGETLKPFSVVDVGDAKDWSTGNPLPEVRVASIVASESKPYWIINLKEAGWVYQVDYQNPSKPKETKMKADNFLHDGGWAQIPGEKEKRYFLVAANAKNRVCVVDMDKGEVMQPCIETGKIPHPGRGANVVHPKYGPVWATPHIGEGKISFIGIDPKGHPDYAWKMVDSITLKSAGSLFVKSHPNSDNLWVDFPLSSVEGVNGEIGVYNMKSGEMKYFKVSDKRIVHPEYNMQGTEVWLSGWLGNELFVYDDKTLELKNKITGDWLKTPTGKFNVYNTQHDIY